MKLHIRVLIVVIGIISILAVILCYDTVHNRKEHYDKVVQDMIPDVVYENIALRLDDGFTSADVLRYYSTHRAWADSIHIYDVESKRNGNDYQTWEEFWNIK